MKITARILDRLSGKRTRALEKIIRKAGNTCSEEQCFTVNTDILPLQETGTPIPPLTSKALVPDHVEQGQPSFTLIRDFGFMDSGV